MHRKRISKKRIVSSRRKGGKTYRLRRGQLGLEHVLRGKEKSQDRRAATIRKGSGGNKALAPVTEKNKGQSAVVMANGNTVEKRLLNWSRKKKK